MFTTKKIAIVSVINDLVTDHRVNKTCYTLLNEGYEVLLIGRKLNNSTDLPAWPFKTSRMNLLVNKGPLFYMLFHCNLFFKLLFKKCDLLYANDLDTLLPNYLISRIKRIPIIYDSHELFCEVPELKSSPLKRKIWLLVEGRIVPKLKNCITVNKSIASIYNEKYKVHFHVVRNIPDTPTNFVPKSRAELNLPTDKFILILQGAGINIDRGAEELLEAMQKTSNAYLLIIGSGDVWTQLTKLQAELKLQNKVKLIPKLSKRDLMQYTFNADLGISIDKPNNLNYLNSLPNKIFDYLHAGLPILASRLPELEQLINNYKVGTFIENHQPNHIAEVINQLIVSPLLKDFKLNTEVASNELNWQTEQLELINVIRSIK